MSVGSKIRAIRMLKNMTQKELGEMVGFSTSTADVRIRQYESNKMVPKEDKLKEIANALDVDVSALKDHDIYSDLDLMQVLFQLEEDWGLTIRKKDGQYVLSFDESNPLTRYTLHNLDCWHQAKTNMLSDADDNYSVLSNDKYKLWKHRFPLDKIELENHNEKLISDKYTSLVKKTLEDGYTITTVKDFIITFEKLIRNGIEIEVINAPEFSTSECYVAGVSLKHSELLAATNDAANAYVEYLSMVHILENMNIEIECSTNTYKGATLSYTYFFNSALSNALDNVVRKLMSTYNNRTIDDKNVKNDYENRLTSFDIEIFSK